MLSSLNYYPCPKATRMKIQSKVKDYTCCADVTSYPPAPRQAPSCSSRTATPKPLLCRNSSVAISSGQHPGPALEAGCHSHFTFLRGCSSFVFHPSDAFP